VEEEGGQVADYDDAGEEGDGAGPVAVAVAVAWAAVVGESEYPGHGCFLFLCDSRVFEMGLITFSNVLDSNGKRELTETVAIYLSPFFDAL
jgi:hypothetical protein